MQRFFYILKLIMNTRENFIKSLRGEQIGVVDDHSSKGERFQNIVLRPILKLQNDLLVEMCQNYLKKNKVDFNSLSIEKKTLAIENALQKDVKFRNSVKGIVIGFFTIDEYKQYVEDSSLLNKRMMTMMIERLKSQIQLFV